MAPCHGVCCMGSAGPVLQWHSGRGVPSGSAGRCSSRMRPGILERHSEWHSWTGVRTGIPDWHSGRLSGLAFGAVVLGRLGWGLCSWHVGGMLTERAGPASSTSNRAGNAPERLGRTPAEWLSGGVHDESSAHPPGPVDSSPGGLAGLALKRQSARGGRRGGPFKAGWPGLLWQSSPAGILNKQSGRLVLERHSGCHSSARSLVENFGRPSRPPKRLRGSNPPPPALQSGPLPTALQSR